MQQEMGTELPRYMQLLHITAAVTADSWLSKRLATQTAVRIELDQCPLAAAMVRLREQTYDAIVLDGASGSDDAQQVVQALRAGSPDEQAIVVLGSQPTVEVADAWLEASADAYVCRHEVSVSTLLWQLTMASARQRLANENRRLQELVARSRTQQQQESFRLLREQRRVLLESDHQDELDLMPPPWLVDDLGELLKIHVMAGAGSLRAEVADLAARLRACHVTVREALLAHNVAVEELVAGQGNRGTWHILGRANLLAYELMLVFAEASHRQTA